MIAIARPLSSLGEIVATAGATELLQSAAVDPAKLLRRHETGNWVELDDEGCQANLDAIESGHEIFSCYSIQGQRVYIITEADRSSTCIMLESEY